MGFTQFLSIPLKKLIVLDSEYKLVFYTSLYFYTDVFPNKNKKPQLKKFVNHSVSGQQWFAQSTSFVLVSHSFLSFQLLKQLYRKFPE